MGYKEGHNYKSKESLSKSIYAITRFSQGATVQQIAKELKLSESAVNKRINTEIELALQNMGNIVARIKVMQTQQLNYIYSQSIQSWNMSADVNEEGLPQKEGDVRFLDTAMKSLKEVRQIWNANRDIEISEDGATIMPEDTASLNVDNIKEVLIELDNLDLLPGGRSIDMDRLESTLTPVEEPVPEIDTIEFEDEKTPDE